MSSIQCPYCEAPVRGDHCSHCGSEIYQRAPRAESSAPAGGTLPMKRIAFFIVLVIFAAVMALRYWSAGNAPASPSSSSVASSSSSTASSKKPLNVPGEAVDLRQHLASGKYTIAYFYADW